MPRDDWYRRVQPECLFDHSLQILELRQIFWLNWPLGVSEHHFQPDNREVEKFTLKENYIKQRAETSDAAADFFY